MLKVKVLTIGCKQVHMYIYMIMGGRGGGGGDLDAGPLKIIAKKHSYTQAWNFVILGARPVGMQWDNILRAQRPHARASRIS